MRVFKILLLSLVVALAGCADDEPSDSTPPPADDATTPPADAGGDEANATPDDGANDTMEEEEPAPPAPREVHSSSHNYAEDPQGAPVTETFTVPEGYQTLYLNVTFTPTGVGVANSASVSITGPNGGSVSCAPTSPMTEAEDCAETVAAEAGEWTLTYSGSGTLSAAVSVAAS